MDYAYLWHFTYLDWTLGDHCCCCCTGRSSIGCYPDVSLFILCIISSIWCLPSCRLVLAEVRQSNYFLAIHIIHKCLCSGLEVLLTFSFTVWSQCSCWRFLGTADTWHYTHAVANYAFKYFLAFELFSFALQSCLFHEKNDGWQGIGMYGLLLIICCANQVAFI